MAAIDLSQLPAPAVVQQLDYETIVQALQSDLTTRAAAVGVDLQPALSLESEPLNLLLETAAYRELTLRSQFNALAEGNMLAYAKGPDLDNLAANLLVAREAGELDPAFLARVLLAGDGFSTAGPDEAYRFHALSADPAVLDVYVSSPAPCQVLVAVLANTAGGVPAASVLVNVQAALSADTVRPMTDQVSVEAATVVTYEVTATLTIGSGPDQATVIAAAQAALQAYGTAQYKLGAGVTLAAITAALMQPGASDVQITAPAASIAGAPGVAPALGQITLSAVTG